MSHRALALSALLAACVLLVGPAAVRAEVVDYDPAEAPPDILTEEELARLQSLQQVTYPGISWEASPDSRYLFVRTPGYGVLDLESRQIVALPPETWDPRIVSPVTPLSWLDDHTAVLVTLDRAARPPTMAKTVVDVAAMTRTSTPIVLPTLEGMAVSPVNVPLLELGGSRQMVAMATPRGAQAILSVEQPSYDVDTPTARDRRARMGLTADVEEILQVDARMVAVDLDTGATTTLGTLPAGANPNVALGSLAISPDGARASYVVRIYHGCVGSVVRGRPCRGGGSSIATYTTREALGLVPPDRNPTLRDSELRIVEIATGDDTVVANVDQPEILFTDTMWRGDGRLVVVGQVPSRFEGRPYPIYTYPRDLAAKVFQSDGAFAADWDVPELVYGGGMELLEGTRVLLMAPANTSQRLFIADLARPTEPAVPVYDLPGSLFGVRLAGSLLVYVRGDVGSPAELYVAEWRDVAGTSQAITHLNDAAVAAAGIAYRRIEYTTSAGHQLEGLYVYPASRPYPPTTPQPVVVWQEGGPGGQMTNDWGSSVESPYTLLPAAGIPVFVVNGSGRVANGPDFYADMADGTNYGQRDIRDVKEGVEALISMGVVDPRRVGVTGCSYGGYFTLQSLVEYPDFYAAGNAQCSLVDLLYEYNFGWGHFMGYLEGRSPVADPAEYVLDSPVYRAHRIKAPLLVFHGTNDFLPHELLVNLHDQVASGQVPARMLRVAGEGHGFSHPNSQRYAAQLQIEWFRRFLAPQTRLSARLLWPSQPDLPRGGRLVEVVR